MYNEVITLKVIGLCGGSGSGKGTVSQLFAEYGIPCIDADEVYHDLTSYMSECLIEIVEHFGSSVVENCKLNRPELAKIVFASGASDKLSTLNSITHKHVKTKICKMIADYRKEGRSCVIIDAPLLFESGLNNECDIIISVICDIDTRIDRIIKRDGISRESAERRVASQKNDDWLSEKSDYVIQNDCDLALLREKVAEIVKRII